jgi:hypothetical protein
MIKLIRRNQKTVLTGLSIVAMITFVANFGKGGGQSASDRRFGTIGGKVIYVSEVTQARAELSALSSFIDLSAMRRNPYTGEFANPEVNMIFQLLASMNKEKDLYLLLRHEAIADKVQVSSESVDAAMGALTHQTDPDSDSYLATREGMTNLLKILTRFDQVASAVKISKPLVDTAQAREDQTLSLNLVQLKADDYLYKLPAPTTQQLQDQFTRFADVTPHQPTPTTNPAGYGYRLPQRAKLQYLRLTPEAVTAAVTATKSNYDWEVQARKYYLANTSEFIPKPATTTSVAATQPSLPKPFEIVREKILTDLRQPLCTALQDDVVRFISTTMTGDWQAYNNFLKSPAPGPAPDSSLGVPYPSFSYLSKLIDKVHTKFNVQLIASETQSGLSEDQIADIPGIGTSELRNFVSQQSQAYLAAINAKDPAAPAKLMEPSPVLAGSDSKSPVFARLTEVLPSRPPANLAEVLPQVETDVRNAAAYKLAKDDADRMVTAAAKSPMTLVALASGKPLIHIDHLSANAYDIPEIVPPLSDGVRDFSRQAFNLLNLYDPAKNPTAAETIELPTQGRVFPTQLVFVNANWNSDSYFQDRFNLTSSTQADFRRLLSQDWLFNLPSVAKRLDFKPDKKDTGS